MYKIVPPYTDLDIDDQSSCVILDHMGGFDCDFKNSILDKLDSCARNNQKKIEVYTEYIFDDTVRDLYPHLDLKFNLKTHKIFLTPLASYNIHPEQTFENFLCSFNGSPHVSRKLLVSILNKLGLFDPKCSTKNFGFSNDHITGHLQDFIGDRNLFYDKFFVNDCAFNQAIYTEDFERLRYDHSKNIYTLESRITSCFVHLVSETLATSYYPYYGEKFLYSVVCRGLFVAYSNPLWHCNLEKYYGFKLYSNLFDYEFDLVKNPVDRLIKLVSMLLKFSHLSTNDWHDLYTLEMDTIEYNYDHYFSGNYLQCLEKLI